ncbi:hypothetical protein M1247_02240 [Mycobacterium sp. 21AC1]|uniref:hypothetical protein n=1 Tax=[Mycobacterium] appelbergii TaxID=2939269 RepID=UPI002938F5A9|nr:hypothetical protein [Mycobacterium sp. 21AC1]MDV3123725.1 hypothetical protein [Mycobacterium sp. 21AC1]
MYTAAIDALPGVGDPEFADRAAVVLSGLRKLQASLGEAAGRSRVTPSVIVALSGVRTRYDELMTTAAEGPGATLGQRLYVARGRAKLSAAEAANGIGVRQDLIEAVEAEEQATEAETGQIKDLIAALGG